MPGIAAFNSFGPPARMTGGLHTSEMTGSSARTATREEKKIGTASGLGEVPVEGVVLVRQKIKKIGREAAHRIREEMKKPVTEDKDLNWGRQGMKKGVEG